MQPLTNPPPARPDPSARQASLASESRRADVLVEKSAQTLGARLKLIARKRVTLWKALLFIMFIAGFTSALVWAVSADRATFGSAKEIAACVYQEAEAGTIAAPMAVFEDSKASQKAFVMAPQGAGSRGGETAVTFVDVAPGDYGLWARVWGPDGDANSFMVQVEQGSEIEFKFSKGNAWAWERVDVRGAGKKNGVITLPRLQAVRVTAKNREDGAKIDALMLLASSARPDKSQTGCVGAPPPPPPTDVPTVSIRVRNERVKEGEKGARAEFVIQRTGDERNRLVVYYLVRGAAALNKDYRLNPSSTTIPASIIIRPGNATAVVTLEPIDDRLKEKDEDAVIYLVRDPSLPTYLVGASLNHATAVITDND